MDEHKTELVPSGQNHPIYISPSGLFDFIRSELISVVNGQRNDLLTDKTLYTKISKPTALIIYSTSATKEELAALNSLFIKSRTHTNTFPVMCESITIELKKTKADKQYLVVSMNTAKDMLMSADGSFMPINISGVKTFIFNGSSTPLCKQGVRKEMSWPATMKDLFGDTDDLQRCIAFLIMQYFAKQNPIWKDLAEDMFIHRSAYSAIPIDEIWAAHSRQELLASHYNISLNRNNREPIGYGIFLARVSTLVNKNELQKLFGFDPGFCYIGRKKESLVTPLSRFISENTPGIDKHVRIARGHTVRISTFIIEDALRATLSIRRPVRISFHSARAVLDWHDEVTRICQARDCPVVAIPKDSKYKKLKMPSNCVRLTTRRQFIEEGNFQHNCVATYISDVNADACSIWSMRKDDGSRNTIEIRTRTSKNNPNGYFYIAQMTGFGNSEVPEDDYAAVRNALESQAPLIRTKTKKN